MSSVKEQIAAIVDQRGPIRDYLGNLPPDTKLYPDSRCGCILHGLITHHPQIDPVRRLLLSYDSVSWGIDADAGELNIEGTIWDRVQREWCYHRDGRDDEGNSYIYPATALAILEATE